LPACSTAIQDYAAFNSIKVTQVFQLASSYTAAEMASVLQAIWTAGTGVIVLCM
jgi:hypothetical protein